MMGTSDQNEQSLFSYHIHLERRIRANHPLRRLKDVLDLSFVLAEVRDCYGKSGNVSIDPRTILKMMVLLFYYNIASERELMEQIGERLDFLWFLGLDLESSIPDHSVLSKARRRWGKEVFEKLFTRTLQQCVAAGLVDGRLLHIDSTTLKANASKNSVLESSPEMVEALRQAYREQERKLEEQDPPQEPSSPQKPPEAVVGGPVELVVASEPKPAEVASHQGALPVNCTHISLTDPQAHLAQSKNGRAELSYKEHRMVDDAHGVITAVEATFSVVADGTQLPVLFQQYRQQSGLNPVQTTLAGDKHYGTASNYLYCAQEGLRAHLAPARANVKQRGKLEAGEFVYEPARDRYRCPQGHYLQLHQSKPQEQVKVYRIEKAQLCSQCPLRSECTDSVRGRLLKRHFKAELIERSQKEAQSAAGRYSRKRRKHVMEGSFADAANNHGCKHARWRGLARQQIQSWLICACQNLRILMQRTRTGPKKVGVSLQVGVAAVKRMSLVAFDAELVMVGNTTGKKLRRWVGWLLEPITMMVEAQAAVRSFLDPLGQHAVTSAATMPGRNCRNSRLCY